MGETKRSPTFNAGPNDKLKWCLSINPKGLDAESKEYLSLYLLLVQANTKNEVQAKFKFTIISTLEEKKNVKLESQRPYKFRTSKDWGFRKYINRDFLYDDKNGLLTDDTLTIFCEVSLVQEVINVTGQTNMLRNLRIPQPTLTEDLTKLFECGLYSDCVLEVKNKVFKAHKAILATRSPVFAAMFQHGTIESNENKIIINDLDGEVISELLRFMYTETCPNLQLLGHRLFIAADKYQVERLRILSEHSLSQSLTVHNVCQTFILSEMYCAPTLRAKCIQFINKHSSDLMTSPDWSEFIQQNPLLLSQIYKAMVEEVHSPTIISGTPPKKRLKPNGST
uniref:BTB domain-containing protein n=1 Tax=Rhabditophanes sp. KR3021 TaxID=114890 RepID=A0AC35UB19_9BILA